VLSRRLRFVALGPVAAAGFALALHPGHATADTLPVPTVTTPLGTVTLPAVTAPTVLPATTAAPTSTATGTGPASSPSAAAAGGPATSGTSAEQATAAAPSDDAAVAGALRLPSGLVSVPVASVRLPTELRLAVTVTPRTLRRPAQAVVATVRVTDTRGYVVRGARVAVVSAPKGSIRAVAPRRTAADGRLVLRIRQRAAAFRAARLTLVVTAADPLAPKAAAAARRVSVLLRPAK
jgi:hypothetical protein